MPHDEDLSPSPPAPAESAPPSLANAGAQSGAHPANAGAKTTAEPANAGAPNRADSAHAGPPQRQASSCGEPSPAELLAVVRFRSLPAAVLGGGLLLLAALTAYLTRDGWLYALASSTPTNLGRAEDAARKGRFRHNRFVTLSFRPLLDTEGHQRRPDVRPGCLTGPSRTFYFLLAAETGDHLVVQRRKSLRAVQGLPERVRVTGRLIRLARLPEVERTIRHFLYQLTDCRGHPRTCNRSLLITADLLPRQVLPLLGTPGGVVTSQEGYRIELRRPTPLFLMLRYHGQWEYRVLNATLAEAVARVKGLGAPWAYVESRGRDHTFILRAPRARAAQWIRAQRKGSGYAISERLASHLTTFGWLARRDDQLVVTHVRQGFPPDYVPAPEGIPPHGATLRAVPHRGTVRVPLTRLVKISYSGPRHLPPDAYLLVVGQSPRAARPALAVAGLAAALALAGLGLLFFGLRRHHPRNSADDSK